MTQLVEYRHRRRHHHYHHHQLRSSSSSFLRVGLPVCHRRKRTSIPSIYRRPPGQSRGIGHYYCTRIRRCHNAAKILAPVLRGFHHKCTQVRGHHHRLLQRSTQRSPPWRECPWRWYWECPFRRLGPCVPPPHVFVSSYWQRLKSRT